MSPFKAGQLPTTEASSLLQGDDDCQIEAYCRGESREDRVVVAWSLIKLKCQDETEQNSLATAQSLIRYTLCCCTDCVTAKFTAKFNLSSDLSMAL